MCRVSKGETRGSGLEERRKVEAGALEDDKASGLSESSSLEKD